MLLPLVGLLLVAACGDPLVVVGDLPGILRVVAGDPPEPLPDGGTPATALALTSPRGLAVDREGRLFLTDEPTARVVEVTPAGEARTIVDHRSCSAAVCLDRPWGLALDAEGRLIVADPGADRIVSVDPETGAVMLVAGDPAGLDATVGVPATGARLDDPTGVVVAPGGEIYFTERAAHRVWRIERGGTLTPVAGTGELGDRGDGDQAVEARLRTPAGLALDGDGLYIADTGNHRVRLVDLSSGVIRPVAGTGTPGFSGDGGAATAAALRSPEDVALTPDGVTLYVSDRGNGRVRSVTLTSGVIRTFAGTGEGGYAGSGLEAGATPLPEPSGLGAPLSLGAPSEAQRLLFIGETEQGLVWRTSVRF